MDYGMQIFGDSFNRQVPGSNLHYGNGTAIFGTDILGESMIFGEIIGQPIIRGLEQGRSLDRIFQEIDQNMEQVGIRWKSAASAQPGSRVTVTVVEAQAGAQAARETTDRNDRDDDVTVEVFSEESQGNNPRMQVARQNGRSIGFRSPVDGKVYGIFNYPDFLRYLEETHHRQDNSWGTAGLDEDDLVSAAEQYYGARNLREWGFSTADVQQRAQRFLSDNRQNVDNFEFQSTASNVATGAAAGAAAGAAIGVWGFGVGAIPAALVGAGIGALGGLIFGSGKDKGLSQDDVQVARQTQREDTTTINNPKFLQFLKDQYEAGNDAVYADGLNSSINETDMQNAINLWNQSYGNRHGFINADKDSFSSHFNGLVNQYDNWGIDVNVTIDDIEDRLKGVSAAERQYTDGPRY